MELLINALVGIFFTIVTQLSKRFKIPSEWVVWSLCLVAGVIYTIIYWSAPGIVEKATQFFLATAGFSIGIYEFFIKNKKKK